MSIDKRTRRSWYAMRNRCHNPANGDFAHYGGRGLTICARWASSFENFQEDMGVRPEGTSLGRIDNERGYEPGNCRWETPAEQARNTRRVVLIDGMTQLEYAASVGLSDSTIQRRRAAGLPLDAPKGQGGRARLYDSLRSDR